MSELGGLTDPFNPSELRELPRFLEMPIKRDYLLDPVPLHQDQRSPVRECWNKMTMFTKESFRGSKIMLVDLEKSQLLTSLDRIIYRLD